MYTSPMYTLQCILRNPKDQRPPLSSAGVYKYLCFCGQVYIGETGRMVNLWIKKHQCDAKTRHGVRIIKTQY